MGRNRFGKVILILLAAAIVITMSSCSTLKGDAERTTTVSVSGNGIVYLDADMVKFSINIRETAKTTAEAQQLTNKKMAAVLDILKAHGIEDEIISTTALNFSSEYYWDNEKQTQVKSGEAVSQTVYVTMKDINEFPVLADDLGTNINGISFYNVSFDSTQKIVAGKTARELAYQDALQKAQLYAAQTGLELSRPLEINEGYVSFSSANFKRMYAEDAVATMAAAPEAAYGTQTPAGMLTAEIDISVTFELR